MACILVVDADGVARARVARQLEALGHTVSQAPTCRAAAELLRGRRPDLVLIEQLMPDMSGIDFLRRLHQGSEVAPPRVIILSARNDVRDIVQALDSGADDYVVKPFRPSELLARVRAALRHCAVPVKADVLTVGELSMDRLSHRVSAGGTPLALTPAEYRLLEYLLLHPTRVHARDQLLARAWGRVHGVSPRTVDVHVRRLRQALEPHGLDGMIRTVRGFGYRLCDPAEPDERRHAG